MTAPHAAGAGAGAGADDPAAVELGLLGGFLTQVRDRPHATALLFNGDETSYRELYELAGRERDRLALLDLAPGVPVGVLADKSPAAVALVLACLLARRPLLLPSPALADTLLADLFAQAGCARVLAPGGESARVAPNPEVEARPLPADEAAEVAFMLTTSGSTSLPKIVPLGLDAVDRFTRWAGNAFGIGPGRTVLNYAPLNFDLCLLDVWTTLARGGRVVLVDPALAAHGRHLRDLVLRHGVDVVQAVPMAFGLLQDAAAKTGDTFPGVEHVMFTGDAIPDRVFAALPGLFPQARIHNIYGCTETNDSFVHEVGPAESTATSFPPVPIGRPLPGVHALVIDPDTNAPVEGPGSGELFVSTPFQTRGYLDRTRHADKFTGHPLGLDDRRWFRTGDLVRRDAAGTLHLTGRTDFQVKVRGVAVNTAEIERVLQEHPGVLEAGVAALPDPIAGKRLVAGVQRAPGSALTGLQLRTHCARHLPRAAVPHQLVLTDAPLPKTATGKVDRKALDRLDQPASTTASTRASTTAPTTTPVAPPLAEGIPS
ncbi:AMP-binding protein [Streptomyces sp. ISL-94]|uniref:AMP-binding protein n=1 Tax=Streptomyces sp. ISL-94 TaxID=2819190 RepID=UPI001BEBD4A3|nr:AMP-binding protein [Streptomyces sp. ISL-94]MBT2479855.1 AMP-binding protein [Streptomyces sp. ISL-94]